MVDIIALAGVVGILFAVSSWLMQGIEKRND